MTNMFAVRRAFEGARCAKLVSAPAGVAACFGARSPRAGPAGAGSGSEPGEPPNIAVFLSFWVRASASRVTPRRAGCAWGAVRGFGDPRFGLPNASAKPR